MNEKVLRKLKYFGLTDIDKYLLEDIIDEVETEILNFCNLTELPKGLESVVVIRTVGNILNMPFIKSKIDIEGLDFERAISSITRGDISMSFKGDGDVDKLENYISKLNTYGEDQLYNFRRIVWN